MQSFEVNISICQPENSDVHRGFASVNITFEDCLILMLTEKECTNDLLYDTACLSFPNFILGLFIFINLLKSDVPCAPKIRLFQQLLFKFLMRCVKELHSLNYCFHKMNKFLIQNI